MPTTAEIARARRGAVFLFHRVKFQGDPRVHQKYCVLMEGYDPAKHTLIVAFCTSRTEFYYQPSTVLIEWGHLPGLVEPTLVQLDNYREIPTRHLFSRRCMYVGQLPQELLVQVDNALEHLQWSVDEATWLRMCG
jgi:hypothetical protein